MHRAEAEKYLAEMVTQMSQVGVQADAVILEGEAAERVVEHSRVSRSDLILLSSHGQSGLSGWNVSSVVQKIILRVYTSIMVVRAHQPAPAELAGLRYQRLLLPMDGSQRAECVLPPAEMLARAHDAHVLFAHVVRRPEMPRRMPLSPEEVDLVERIVESNKSEATHYLDELKSRLSANAETRLLVKDSVEAALHDLVDQDRVDLVILSAHGHTGESRWPHGCVVTSFLSYGSTPLLIIQDVPQDDLRPGEQESAPQHEGRQ